MAAASAFRVSKSGFRDSRTPAAAHPHTLEHLGHTFAHMRKNPACRLTSLIALASPLSVPRRFSPKPRSKETFCMTDYRVRAGDIEEDQVTSLMESYSAQLPSSFFLGAAGASIIASLIAKQ